MASPQALFGHGLGLQSEPCNTGHFSMNKHHFPAAQLCAAFPNVLFKCLFLKKNGRRNWGIKFYITFFRAWCVSISRCRQSVPLVNVLLTNICCKVPTNCCSVSFYSGSQWSGTEPKWAVPYTWRFIQKLLEPQRAAWQSTGATCILQNIPKRSFYYPTSLIWNKKKFHSFFFSRRDPLQDGLLLIRSI